MLVLLDFGGSRAIMKFKSRDRKASALSFLSFCGPASGHSGPYEPLQTGIPGALRPEISENSKDHGIHSGFSPVVRAR